MQVLADRDGKERANDSSYCLVLNMVKDLFILVYVVGCSYSHYTILCFQLH